MGFDAHIHLDFPEFDEDRTGVVERARSAGVVRMVLAGTEPQHWDRTARVATTFGFPFTLGVHPWYIDPDASIDAAMAHLACSASAADGLGELGLDFIHARDSGSRERQVAWFRAQLAVARDLERPIVLHAVRCHAELLRLLKRDGCPRAGGMLHAWSGAPEQVAEFLRHGLYLSFDLRTLARASARTLHSMRATPDDRVLLESDAPGRWQGRRTEPADVRSAAHHAADLLGRSFDTIWEQTAQNAERLWGKRASPRP